MIGDNDTVVGRRHYLVSLHVKLASLLAAIVVAAVAALTAYDVLDEIRQHQSAFAEHQLALARLATAEADDLFRHTTQDLTMLSSEPSLLAAASLKRYTVIDRQLERYVAKDPELVSIAFVDASGRIRAISTTDKSMVGTDSSRGPIVVEALRRRAPTIGTPRIGNVTKTALAPLAIPVIDDGTTLGVLVGSLSLQRLGSHLAGIQVGRMAVSFSLPQTVSC